MTILNHKWPPAVHLRGGAISWSCPRLASQWLVVAAGAAGCLLVGAMLLWTWSAWADLTIDFGREACVAWAISRGAALYRDVAYFNGPLSPHINALVLSVCGRSLQALLIFNAMWLSLIAILLFDLIRNIANQRCGLFCVFIFFSLFAFGHYSSVSNYNYLAPYSHEMTHGLGLSLLALALLGRWRAAPASWKAGAAGAAVGLVFLTKPELFAAVALACLAAFALAAVCKDAPRGTMPRAIAASSLGLAAVVAACLTIIVRAGSSWSEAWDMIATPWRHVFNSRITGMDFYRAGMGLDAPGRSVAAVAFWFLLQWLVLRIAVRNSRNGPARPAVDLALGGAVVAIALLSPPSAYLFFSFASLPVWLLVILFFGVKELSSVRDTRLRSQLGAGLVFTVFGLALLAKMALNTRIYHYGFVLAMPGVLAVVCACWRLAQEIERGGGSSRRFAAVMLLTLGVLAAAHFELMASSLSRKNSHVQAADATIRCSAEEAAACRAMLADMKRKIAVDQTLAVWPQGCLLNVAMQRANPTPYIVLMPPELEMFGEEAIVRSYQRAPPDYVLLVHCDDSEYGLGRFGQGYASKLWAWLWNNYRPVATHGADPFRSDRFGMTLFAARQLERAEN